MSALPHVVILATGGTIAGRSVSRTDSIAYQPAAVAIEALLAALPELESVARVSGEQFAQIASADVTVALWQRLALQVSALLADASVDGVVITHGTDTMEETAWFLNLTVANLKPVVLVGAMRPSSALSADGPANLLHAVRVAATPAATGRGVLVVMHAHVHAAREVAKFNTSALDAFRSHDAGVLGTIIGDQVHWSRTPTKPHTLASPFCAAAAGALPAVEILFGYAGCSRTSIDALVRAGIAGLVFAGVGDGCVSAGTLAALLEARRAGVQIVRASRVASGYVSRNGQVDDDGCDFIAAGSLSPQKARIVLMLGLAAGGDTTQLQSWFDML